VQGTSFHKNDPSHVTEIAFIAIKQKKMLDCDHDSNFKSGTYGHSGIAESTDSTPWRISDRVLCRGQILTSLVLMKANRESVS
jgi:hypothetical protein